MSQARGVRGKVLFYVSSDTPEEVADAVALRLGVCVLVGVRVGMFGWVGGWVLFCCDVISPRIEQC